MNLILAYMLLFIQTEVPFKAKDEFEIKLDYQVKKRSTAEFSGYTTQPTTKNDEAIPYVILNVKILKASAEEPKIVVNSNLQDYLFKKKVEEGTLLKLDLGFTEDVKNRVTAHEYIINFINEKKMATHKILIQIEQDGTFYVNAEKRGKF